MSVLTLLKGGTIHFFFEGYFALNHTRMGAAQDLFGQLWKEYALSDSRYLTSDPFVLCMESITAVRIPGRKSFRSELTCSTALLGSPFLLYSIHDRGQPSSPTPASGVGISGPDIWRCSLLCNLHVRPLPQEPDILPARSILFLVLLLFHELHLDRDSWR